MTTAVRTPPSQSVDPAAYQRWVRRQKAYGRWEPLADAEPVRAHVRGVMRAADIGARRYADLAGISRGTLNSLLYGLGSGQAVARVTSSTARKLLAVRADAAHGLTLPAVGTIRRIHVLIGEGWPQIHLGPRFDTHPQYVSQILQRDRVTTATAEAVARAYAALEGIDPIADGIPPHGVALAKNAAIRNGWRDRAYWDDVGRIDDPTYDPASTDGSPRYMSLGEDAIWLSEQGLTRRQVADRLGESVDYIDQSIRRYHAALAQKRAVA
ncbi:hypothetical protein [Actinacidiphila sp. ITFR-21]|uniref:hypothetical protein n=1 Tax=Actinacidiphila sp. ITFR-21 TaxID=3075199 RepID=UPI0028896412|nr:hypothetical protein [Streptomyces sp. ITFR-21]WNI19137.1 hypothetical protein RLT57_28775 [Streptomyces sp. ITFR-21]